VLGKAGRQVVELCNAALNLGSIVAFLNILADVLSSVAGTIIPPGGPGWCSPAQTSVQLGVSYRQRWNTRGCNEATRHTAPHACARAVHLELAAPIPPGSPTNPPPPPAWARRSGALAQRVPGGGDHLWGAAHGADR
jgi:hypothetical protein